MVRRKRQRDSQRTRKGAVTVTAALCLSAFLGVLALAIDGGLWMAERRRAQAAADSAALAAASVLYERFNADKGLDPTGKAKAAAIEYAEKYGYTNDETTTPKQIRVIVEIPPSSDEGAANPESQYERQFVGKAGYVKVRVQTYQRRLFSAVFGGGGLFVARRAVAGGVNTTFSYSSAAIIALDPSSAESLTTSGNPDTRLVTNAGIKVKSNNSAALTVKGGGGVTAPEIEIVGGTKVTGGGVLKATVLAPREPIVDPLASIKPPDPADLSLPLRSYNGGSTLNPGVYNSGISITGGTSVTMNPGVYYIKSGGFSLGGNSNLTGAGVMIYIADGGGKLDFQGGGVVKMSAPTNGPYAGMILYQDRNSNTALSIAGGANTKMTGTLYAPGAALAISGGAPNDEYGSQIIVRTLSITGGANFVTTGDPTKSARRAVSVLGLVE